MERQKEKKRKGWERNVKGKQGRMRDSIRHAQLETKSDTRIRQVGSAIDIPSR